MSSSRSEEPWNHSRAHTLPLTHGVAPAQSSFTVMNPVLGGSVGLAGGLSSLAETETFRDADERTERAHKIPLHVRLIEIGFASTVLILSMPVLLIVALIIKLGTPGPVLFRQARVGIDRRPFRFVKFRTLYADARERFPTLYEYRYSQRELDSLKFKVDNDPRVTPQGNWLRRSTLDELPNFWNVLKGDMAIVGPRPDIPEMLPYYTDEMIRKFDVRPGITGLAQVSGRGRLGFYETVALDVEYVRKRSLWFDIKIVLKTMKIVLVGDGAF